MTKKYTKNTYPYIFTLLKTLKAVIIKTGIIKINDWFFSINIFSIAGSRRYAIEEVLPAKRIEKNTESNILFKNLPV